MRELEAKVRLYANQIQVLAVRNAELEDQHRQRTAADDATVELFRGER